MADDEVHVGPYALQGVLGEGGNGQVYLAWKPNPTGIPLPVVLKFPLQRFATEAADRERFLKEARLAMLLGAHPNIVHVSDVDLHKGMPYIVMAYVDGLDLNRVLKHCRDEDRGLPLAAVYSMSADAAAGLHYAHVEAAETSGNPVRIVHRDVKPGNMLVTRDGHLKLCDFGISTTMDEVTSGKFMRGTYRYMSPEHIRCEIRPEMDIYALGVIAWEMVENRVYREEHQGSQHFTATLDGQTPKMENSSTPEPLMSLIEACLEPNPRQRPTAAQFMTALRKCPGFSRDPEHVKTVVSSILGSQRRTGRTLNGFSSTPELAATFAALEVAAKPTADPVLPRGPGEDEPGKTKGREADAPNAYRRRPGTPGKPTPTATLSAKHPRPVDKTVLLAAPFPEVRRGEQRVAADIVLTVERGRTEPAPAAHPSPTPGRAFLPFAAETLDVATRSVAVKRRRPARALAGVFLGSMLALVAALLVGHFLGLDAYSSVSPGETVGRAREASSRPVEDVSHAVPLIPDSNEIVPAPTVVGDLEPAVDVSRAPNPEPPAVEP
ncbi:MAG: protein kinase, partial [Nannocystaceae bacterium]|nr:protein kinase [Nannocystaceae bacterium]